MLGAEWHVGLVQQTVGPWETKNSSSDERRNSISESGFLCVQQKPQTESVLDSWP